MEIPSKKARIRKAEKDRKFSTCQFADRVFHCVTKQLDQIVQKGHWPEEALPYRNIIGNDIESKLERQQAVLAGFLVYDKKIDLLECVSLGMGTKFIDGHLTNQTGKSDVVHDMHAEVLAKKGFK